MRQNVGLTLLVAGASAIVFAVLTPGTARSLNCLWTPLEKDTVHGGAICNVDCLPDGWCPDPTNTPLCGAEACTPKWISGGWVWKCLDYFGEEKLNDYWYDHCATMEDSGWVTCAGATLYCTRSQECMDEDGCSNPDPTGTRFCLATSTYVTGSHMNYYPSGPTCP